MQTILNTNIWRNCMINHTTVSSLTYVNNSFYICFVQKITGWGKHFWHTQVIFIFRFSFQKWFFTLSQLILGWGIVLQNSGKSFGLFIHHSKFNIFLESVTVHRSYSFHFDFKKLFARLWGKTETTLVESDKNVILESYSFIKNK